MRIWERASGACRLNQPVDKQHDYCTGIEKVNRISLSGAGIVADMVPRANPGTFTFHDHHLRTRTLPIDMLGIYCILTLPKALVSESISGVTSRLEFRDALAFGLFTSADLPAPGRWMPFRLTLPKNY